MIQTVRSILFEKIDSVNQQLIDSFKILKGVYYYVDKRKDKIVFQLPISQPVTKIKYPDPSYSLRLLLEDVKEMSINTNTTSFSTFLNTLENCSFGNKHTKRLQK